MTLGNILYGPDPVNNGHITMFAPVGVRGCDHPFVAGGDMLLKTCLGKE